MCVIMFLHIEHMYVVVIFCCNNDIMGSWGSSFYTILLQFNFTNNDSFSKLCTISLILHIHDPINHGKHTVSFMFYFINIAGSML